ncbi:hypothetical protein VTN96DRAFT_3860 [Rasamsonia emersonii]
MSSFTNLSKSETNSAGLACQKKDNDRPRSSPTGEQQKCCSSSREEQSSSQEQQQLTTSQNQDSYCPYHGPILQMDLNNRHQLQKLQQQQQQSTDPMTRLIHDNHPGEQYALFYRPDDANDGNGNGNGQLLLSTFRACTCLAAAVAEAENNVSGWRIDLNLDLRVDRDEVCGYDVGL